MSTESKIILVAYATRYGSTREVAEAVAATMREEGIEAVATPAQKVAALDGYRAVVLGAPLYFGSWHKDALKLLARNRSALQGLPVAVFALGPLRDVPHERQETRAQLQKTLAGLRLEPLCSEVFCGKYDPAKLRFTDRLIAGLPASPLHGAPASDARDWGAIRAWARELAGKLR
jgi:menaquinone-dependent protoporphyrinogen oxidase